MPAYELIKKIYHKCMDWVDRKRRKRFLVESIVLLQKQGDVKPINTVALYANRYRVLQYYERHDAGDYALELNFLKSNFPRWMQCTKELEGFIKGFVDEVESIKFDYEKKMYYACHNNRKMYFKKSMTKDVVIQYYTITCFEQSASSAHRYLDKDFDVESESVVLDLGAAEGIFALDIIDKAKEIYLFECDAEWVEALECTFNGCDNVHIINKYVADINSDDSVTLDAFCDAFAREKLFIKMDIEGAEVKAVKGAKKLINQVKDLKIAACTYHQQRDYETISSLLEGMQLSKADGYLCPLSGKLKPPYFRVGVLRAMKGEKG